jgi:ribosomal protein S15P/S13E
LKPQPDLSIVLILLLVAPLVAAQSSGWKPTILIYSPSMPGFAEGIAQSLSEEMGEGFEYLPVDDPNVLSSMLSMPNVGCVILPVFVGRDVSTLIEPIITYFEGGGAVIGFQGTCAQAQAGRLAREVFPAFGNATGSPTRKNGISLNEYVGDVVVEGFQDLPGEFDLVGQFFTYPVNGSRKLIEPNPDVGEKTVLFREKKTGAPLVIAYEHPSGSRSISLTGLFVRPSETASNYYGNLLADPNFVALLSDSVGWTVGGATRSSRFESDRAGLMEDEKDRIEDLLAHSEKARKDQENRRTLLLAVSWVLGIGASLGLVYVGFFRGREGPN